VTSLVLLSFGVLRSE
jgi:hypothetical protein